MPTTQPPGRKPVRPVHAPNSGNGGRVPQTKGRDRNQQQNQQKSPSSKSGMAKAALKFAFMPEIGRSLDGLKMARNFLVNMVAQIYETVNLIPKNHPCVDLRNAHEYKLKDIIGIAYTNLKWEKSQVPQIIIFFGVILFLLFIVLSLVTIIFNFSVHSAHAQTPTDSNSQINDVLNTIFNVQAGGSGALPTALGQMLKAYSNLVLVLAGIIVLYHIIQYVVESARHGTPGGKSFNHAWGPVRLVAALGLLIPLSSGLNSGQYIIIYLAKWGSDVASNVYNQFNDSIGLGQGITASKVSNPIKKGEALKDLFNLYACAYARNAAAGSTVINLPTASDFDLNSNPNGDYTHEVKFNTISGTSVGNTNGCGSIKFFYKPRATNPNEIILNQQFTYFSANRANIDSMAQQLISHFDPQSPNYYQALQTTDLQSQMDSYAQAYNKSIQTSAETAATAANTQLAQKMKASATGFGWIMAPAYYYQLGELNSKIAQAQEDVPQVINNGSNVFDYVTGNGQSGDPAQDNSSGNQPGSLDVSHMPSFNPMTTIANFFKDAFPMFLSGNVVAHLLNIIVSNSANPLLSLISFGNTLMWSASAVWASWIAVSALTGTLMTVGVAVVEAANPMLQTLAMLMFTTGATLAIVLPLLPTVRFLFAVLGWVIIVLVAVMGMPLFALAHLKTGGEGWIGQLQVASAYNMIMGIILRPTLIIIGFITGLMLFNNIVHVLAMIYEAGVTDVATVDGSTGGTVAAVGGAALTFATPYGLVALIPHVVGEVFKLFMMSVLFQAIANSCFKLVDIIPTQAMTWMGTSPISNPVEDGAETFSRESQGLGSKMGELQSSAAKGIGDFRTKMEISSQSRMDQAAVTGKKFEDGKALPYDSSNSKNDTSSTGSSSSPAAQVSPGAAAQQLNLPFGNGGSDGGAGSGGGDSGSTPNGGNSPAGGSGGGRTPGAGGRASSAGGGGAVSSSPTSSATAPPSSPGPATSSAQSTGTNPAPAKPEPKPSFTDRVFNAVTFGAAGRMANQLATDTKAGGGQEAALKGMLNTFNGSRAGTDIYGKDDPNAPRVPAGKSGGEQQNNIPRADESTVQQLKESMRSKKDE